MTTTAPGSLALCSAGLVPSVLTAVLPAAPVPSLWAVLSPQGPARTGCPQPLSRVSAGYLSPTLPHQDFCHVLRLLTLPPHYLKGT